jgi:hypothetical protein
VDSLGADGSHVSSCSCESQSCFSASSTVIRRRGSNCSICSKRFTAFGLASGNKLRKSSLWNVPKSSSFSPSSEKDCLQTWHHQACCTTTTTPRPWLRTTPCQECTPGSVLVLAYLTMPKFQNPNPPTPQPSIIRKYALTYPHLHQFVLLAGVLFRWH